MSVARRTLAGVATQIFVNLPVADLERSKHFFTALGFAVNEQFTDEKAACIVISETIYAMLLLPGFFRTFTRKAVADADRTTEVVVSLALESRERVDELCERALQSGGRKNREPQDHGFMYERSFEDPDGHQWEVFWMDPSRVEE